MPRKSDALRGLQTLGVRLERLESSTLRVANWQATQPDIKAVFHPALASCPGHKFWQRDFTGSTSVFSILFRREVDPGQVEAFVDSLRLFKIGFSWGGATALAILTRSSTYPGRTMTGALCG